MKLNIEQFKPCEDGLKYYESKASFEEAWNACDRGDWMLWLAKKLKVYDRVFTRAKALCANTVRHLMKDERSKAAVDAALMYADGKISREELKWYARDAKAAYRAAEAAEADVKGNTAYWAAYAAYLAATRAAFLAADAAFGATASAASLRETAAICREVLTEAVFEKVKQINDK